MTTKTVYDSKTINPIVDNENINNYLNSNNKENNIYSDNLILITSEKDNQVYLPYKVSEVNAYLEQFPEEYSSFEEVVEREFIIPLDYYMKHPISARFREAYSLIRDREGKNIIEALNYAFSLMFKYNLNPVIIAACKTEEQLENYLECLEHERLDKFQHFEIEFRINPIRI